MGIYYGNQFLFVTNFYQATGGSRILHILLVKHYNDLLDRQSSERGTDELLNLHSFI